MRTIWRDGRDDSIHPMALRQACIHHRRGLIDPTAQRPDDAVDQHAHLVIVLEGDIALHDAAFPFEIDLSSAVDHDLGDPFIFDERLQRAHTEHHVDQLLGQDPFILHPQTAPFRSAERLLTSRPQLVLGRLRLVGQQLGNGLEGCDPLDIPSQLCHSKRSFCLLERLRLSKTDRSYPFSERHALTSLLCRLDIVRFDSLPSLRPVLSDAAPPFLTCAE